MKIKLASIVVLLLIINSTSISAESTINGSHVRDAASILSEIGEKINKSENIYYDNITINGNMDLSQLNLNSSRDHPLLREFPCEIEITNSKIFGSVIGDGICFQKPVSFEKTVFLKSSKFSGSCFQDLLELSGSIFNESASFDESHFWGAFDCRDASFSSGIFDGSIFSGESPVFAGSSFGEARFKNVQFNGPGADFNGCLFKGLADFSSARFREEPIFLDSKFLGESLFIRAEFLHNPESVDFKWLVFDGPVDYYNATFYGEANFEEAKFNDYASFESTVFGGNAIFNNSRFSNEAYFKNALFCGDAEFDSARLGNGAFFDNALFKKTISLTQARYQRFYARWSNLENKLKYNDETYLSLIQNYNDLGWFEDANNCYYGYRCEYREQNCKPAFPPSSELSGGFLHYLSFWASAFKNSLLWTADALFMSINGYGVNPFWPLYWMVIAISLFGIYYWLAEATPFWTAIKFSAIVFLSGSGKLFVEAPDYKPRPKNSGWLAFISIIIFYFERIIGMIIFVAFLIAFGKTVLR